MEGFLVLVGLAVLAVPALLVVALVSIGTLKRRVAELEEAVAVLRRTGLAPGADRAASPAAAPASAPRAAPASAPPPAGPATPAVGVASPPQPPPAPRPAPVPLLFERDPAPSPRGPGLVGRALAGAKRWFTEGNVPVRVGMLVLLAGVAALLKYASDQGWLQLPIELRLAAVAAAALAGLVFGWRQRLARPAFALALQGGAIGALLLVVFAAFRLYGLMPAAAAFGLSVVLVAGLGVLAVLQDSRTLAVLGVLAGFLAPVWLSTGGGNHVALFSYYAVLNAAILAIAWYKAWRVLNLLGFAFTWGIGVLWGVLSYAPGKLATTQPFLLLFFAFYLALPILYARRSPTRRRDLIDGSLVFGTPLVAFSLQAALLEGARLPLAYCALGLALVYLVLAWWLRRREGHAVLAQAHALLAVGFATLAVPLALSAHATACVFALEGAALVWLGLRQQRVLPQWSGLALQLLAAVAFVMGGASVDAGVLRPLANPGFLGALLIAVAGFASAWCWRGHQPRVALGYYLWALAWWCGKLLHETLTFAAPGARVDVLLAAAALTGWIAAEVHRLRAAPALAATTLVALASPLLFAPLQASLHGHPFQGDGAWAWLVYAALGLRSLRCLRSDDSRLGDWAQYVWWLVWPLALSLSAAWLATRLQLATGWRQAAIALPWLALLAVSMWRWPWLRMPRGAGFDRLQAPLQGLLVALLGLWWLRVLSSPGDAAPLPWLPLLNPLELAQLAVLALLVRWCWSPGVPAGLERLRIGLVAGAGFALVTASTLRTVHDWGGIAWDASMSGSGLAQASLTVVWSLLGVAGWISGSRRGRRGLWLAGAILMGVVLVKLILVDRHHLGDLRGIGSFLAYGLLCTLVGWLAPAPPRAVTAQERAA